MRKKLCVCTCCGLEERWIEQFCTNLLPITDLFVINLTQFADRSEELLRKFIPEDKLVLVKNKWEDSFALARNQALEHIPDDMDYFLYIDLDEVLTTDSFPVIEKILNSEERATYIVTIYNLLDENTNSNAFLVYPRFISLRNNKGELTGPYFTSTVHNQLEMKNGDRKFLPILRSPISILHYGYALSRGEMAKKHARSEALLRAQIEKDHDNFFPHLNLAQLLRAKGDSKGCIEHALEVLRTIKESIDKGEPTYEHALLMALDQLATSYLAIGRPDIALPYAQRAIKIKPDYLDALLCLGNIYLELRDLDGAESWYKRYLFVRTTYNEQKDDANLILNHLNSSFLALYNLGMTYGVRGDHKKANEYFYKCYKEEPNFRDTFIKYLYSTKQMGDIKKMNKDISIYLDKNPDKAYIIYEFLGDLGLEDCQVELSKFYYYQASFINEIADEVHKKIINNKWNTIKKEFGDVAGSFFDTYSAQQKTINKIK